MLKHGTGVDGPPARPRPNECCLSRGRNMPRKIRARGQHVPVLGAERSDYIAPEGASRSLLPNPTGPSIHCSHAPLKSNVAQQSNPTTAICHPKLPYLQPPPPHHSTS